ncbi:MAG: helix-turn-helix domain-containing protein [Chloroflexi bacterium]|nr:helix-turn-helix domain-containing protein [Chloroflexota bacterium]
MSDVAEKFGVSMGNVRRLTYSGALPAVKIASQWRYHRNHLPRSLSPSRNGANRFR